MRQARSSALSLLALALLTACRNDAPAPAASRSAAGSNDSTARGPSSAFALAQEPAGAIEVFDAKAKGEAKDVVVVGRLKDTVPGFAAFTLTDVSLPYCGADGRDDACPTPWDYCCIAEDKVAAATISVAVRAKGEVVAVPVPELRNLDLVVVHGALVKAADGTLRLEADGWYRKERPTLPATTVFPK